MIGSASTQRMPTNWYSDGPFYQQHQPGAAAEGSKTDDNGKQPSLSITPISDILDNERFPYFPRRLVLAPGPSRSPPDVALLSLVPAPHFDSTSSCHIAGLGLGCTCYVLDGSCAGDGDLRCRGPSLRFVVPMSAATTDEDHDYRKYIKASHY